MLQACVVQRSICMDVCIYIYTPIHIYMYIVTSMIMSDSFAPCTTAGCLLPMGFSQKNTGVGCYFSSGDLPWPRDQIGVFSSSILQVDSLPLSHRESYIYVLVYIYTHMYEKRCVRIYAERMVLKQLISRMRMTKNETKISKQRKEAVSHGKEIWTEKGLVQSHK